MVQRHSPGLLRSWGHVIVTISAALARQRPTARTRRPTVHLNIKYSGEFLPQAPASSIVAVHRRLLATLAELHATREIVFDKWPPARECTNARLHALLNGISYHCVQRDRACYSTIARISPRWVGREAEDMDDERESCFHELVPRIQAALDVLLGEIFDGLVFALEAIEDRTVYGGAHVEGGWEQGRYANQPGEVDDGDGLLGLHLERVSEGFDVPDLKVASEVLLKQAYRLI